MFVTTKFLSSITVDKVNNLVAEKKENLAFKNRKVYFVAREQEISIQCCFKAEVTCKYRNFKHLPTKSKCGPPLRRDTLRD